MVSNRIIKIDLNKKTRNVVQMVQGDTNRKLTINVFDSDEPYLVNGVGGETIHGAVYIEKPDGTTCGYDSLEDDSPAVTGSGNTLTVYFVPQATTAHGWAYMTVSIFDDEGVELNTFGIDLFIDKKATATISADYWNLKSIEGLTAAVEGLTQQMVRSVNFATPDSNGNVSLLPWQLPYNGVVGGQQVGDVEEALDGLARMQSEIISQEIKDALINCFQHVAWTDEHGQDYVDALELAMRTKLVSISAVFNQGSAVIYDTDDLDTLEQYLTVTAHYSDTTTRTVTNYTLSGTLTAGTSTITVGYGGKTATFDVVVAGVVLPSGYTRYGYIKYTGATVAQAKEKWIRLNDMTDLNALDAVIHFSSSATPSGSSQAFFGVRNDTGANVSCSAYLETDNTVTVWHNMKLTKATGTVVNNKKNVLRIKNATVSPSQIQLNDNPETDVAWTEAVVIPHGLTILTNPIYTGASNYVLSPNGMIGDIVLIDNQNNIVAYYVPVVYNNRIGMYDGVSQTFYSSSTASYTTLGNSNCLYTVGNWS